MCVCLCKLICTMCIRCPRRQEGITSLRTGVIGSCKLPDEGVRKQTQDLCKSSPFSSLLLFQYPHININFSFYGLGIKVSTMIGLQTGNWPQPGQGKRPLHKTISLPGSESRSMAMM